MEAKQVIKRTHYRHSAWKHIETGDVFYFYGTELPIQDGSYKKLYSEDVTQVTISIPVVDEASPHAFADVSVKLPEPPSA